MSQATIGQPTTPLLPRVAAIVAWLCEHQEEIEAIDYGQLSIDWGSQLHVKLTRNEAIRIDPLAPNRQ